MPISTINNASFADTAVHGQRNLIINGAMQVAQRGTSHSVSTGGANYTLDRWALGVNAGVAVTVSQEDDTGDFNKFLRITGASGNTIIQLLTRLEAQDTKRLAGKEVTLSFYARSSSASTVVVYAAYPSATDNFTTTTNFANQSNSITTAFTRFTFTFTVDSNADKGLQILFADNDGIGASATLDIKGVQLELSSQATPFEHRSFGDELARCQRYYYHKPLIIYDTLGSSYNSLSTILYSYHIRDDYPVTMRVSPTLSYSVIHTYNSTDYTSYFDLFGNTERQFHIRVGGTSINPQSDVSLSYTSDAEL